MGLRGGYPKETMWGQREHANWTGEVALSPSPRISKGLQERTSRNGSSHGNMKETSPQEVPLWGMSDGPTAAPEMELAEQSRYQLVQGSN